METFFIRAIQLILSLSILVIVHEFGHFLFARIFKIKVEKFYLFFNPWFSLFKFKPKNSDTEYGVGWLPLGGYVKIAGMIDESMDKEQMALPPQPWEFRSKPAWQRLLVMVAGVLFNFILALCIYSMVLFTWGTSYIPLQNVSLGMDFSETAKEIGFQDGDILWSADNKPFEALDKNILITVADAKTVTVKRNNEMVQIDIPSDFMQRLMREKKGFTNYRFPMVVEEAVSKESINAGLLPGDSLVSVNGQTTVTAVDVAIALNENKSKTIELGYYRQGTAQTVSIPVDENGKLGIRMKSITQIYESRTQTYSIFESIPAGIRLGVNTLTGYVNSMKFVFTKEGASSLGGFGTIGTLFPPFLEWELFWMTTAFLSIILAFMNILPIPALDGGHVLFLLVEVITRRKPNEKFLEYAQMAGMIILFTLLIYANGNDLVRLFFK
ncbi:MAG: RIP metalloprotease RseP [Bacteroidales bacterium]